MPFPPPLPSQLPISLPNFRDISHPIPPRFRIRPGVLYRGSDPSRLSASGIAQLRARGIAVIFDLRSRAQIERAGGAREFEGLERVWVPVFEDGERNGDGDGEKETRRRYGLYAGEGTEGIVQAFLEILDAGKPTFHTILQRLLSTIPPASSNKPVPALLLHCTTGNNRTGIFITMLLLLLNVPPSTVVSEYTLSDSALAPTRHVNVERLLRKGAFEGEEMGERRRKCERMLGARPESMWAFIAEVKMRWGSAEGWFRRQLGLGDEEIGGLRKVMVVQDDDEA